MTPRTAAGRALLGGEVNLLRTAELADAILAVEHEATEGMYREEEIEAAEIQTRQLFGIPTLEVHDLGCRCHPHVSEKDALACLADAALREYREGLRRAAAPQPAPRLDDPTEAEGMDDWFAAAPQPALDWEAFACDGQKCKCHDPFLCSDCGCLQNERLGGEG